MCIDSEVLYQFNEELHRRCLNCGNRNRYHLLRKGKLRECMTVILLRPQKNWAAYLL